MEPPRDLFGSVDVIDSMAAVEFKAEKGRFQATYDSTRDSASLAVVAMVATALGKDPLDLASLQSAVETSALDELIAEPTPDVERDVSISFCYEGFEVIVSSEGLIEATPMGSTESAA